MTETLDQTEDPRLDDLKPLFASAERNFKAYHSLAAKVAAAEGDRDAAVQSWMDTSDDETAVAIRKAIEGAVAKLRALAEENIGDTQISEQDKIKLKAELEVIEKKAKASSRSLRGLAEPFEIDILPHLRKLGDPFLPAQPKGTGSALPKPSVFVACMRNGNPKATMTFPNLSGAAGHMDIPVEDLGKLYAQAAGVPYEDIAKVKEQTTFTFEHGTNGNTWEVTTTPKDTTNRGRQSVTETTTPVETAEVA